jgi:hypothetical protein
MRRASVGLLCVAWLAWWLWPSTAVAYIEAPHSFGQIVAQATNVLIMRVEKVDKERNLIIYRKVRDVKGVHPGDVIKHNIGKAGFHPREWQTVMEWAEAGKQAVFMHNGGASETYIDTYWYQTNAGGEWWVMTHAEPFLLRTYAGKVDKLPGFITEVMAGKETIVPCMTDGNKDDLHLRRGKIQRLRASLKLQDYNPKRDFVGWGGDDIRRLAGLPGFSHLATLGRVDADAQAVSIVDADGDGKPDLTLAGPSRAVVLQNGGDGFSEMPMPNLTGARAAIWADYNGDGKPDLFAATPAGPKLYTNLGAGQFRDDSAALPREAGYHLTAAAWIDQNNDGKPDLLLANGYHGLRLYRNQPPAEGIKSLTPPKLGDWHICGPFLHDNGQGFDQAYPPEQGVDLSKKYPNVPGEDAVWRKQGFADNQVHSLTGMFRRKENLAAYLYRSIECAVPADLPISLGSDDTLSVFLNGERIFHQPYSRGAAPDQDRLTLKLKAGTNHLLLKICQGGGDWGFFFRADAPTLHSPKWFVDASAEVGLGPDGLAGNLRGDTLAIADVNGDGKADFLFGTGTGLLVLNTGKGFVASPDCGIRYTPGKVGPVWADYDGDGHVDLFVPQPNGGSKLFRNDGTGKFADATATSGDLVALTGHAVCAAWGDFNNDGLPDLLVGCLRGPNRYYQNLGGGKFRDQTEAIGLTQKLFNTQALALADVNLDGWLDVVFVNEGQESVLLLGAPPATPTNKLPVVVTLAGKAGLVGSRVRVVGAEGATPAQTVSGGDGRGGQTPLMTRFVVAPGKYRVEVRDSAGQTATKDVVVTTTPVRVVVE